LCASAAIINSVFDTIDARCKHENSKLNHFKRRKNKNVSMEHSCHTDVVLIIYADVLLCTELFSNVNGK
jgi:hypothetical protein